MSEGPALVAHTVTASVDAQSNIPCTTGQATLLDGKCAPTCFEFNVVPHFNMHESLVVSLVECELTRQGFKSLPGQKDVHANGHWAVGKGLQIQAFAGFLSGYKMHFP